jgi:hypothetical protein
LTMPTSGDLQRVGLGERPSAQSCACGGAEVVRADLGHVEVGCLRPDGDRSRRW